MAKMEKKRYFVYDIDDADSICECKNPNEYCENGMFDEGDEFYEIQIVKKYKVKSSEIVYKLEEVK